MNNDMDVITPDWMERLAEKAMRKGTGVVGGLLLYEDGTIQDVYKRQVLRMSMSGGGTVRISGT